MAIDCKTFNEIAPHVQTFVDHALTVGVLREPVRVAEVVGTKTNNANFKSGVTKVSIFHVLTHKFGIFVQGA